MSQDDPHPSQHGAERQQAARRIRNLGIFLALVLIPISLLFLFMQLYK